MMEITSLQVRHVRVRLRRPVKHASHTRTETENLVVVCTLSDGSIGYGEGIPREYVTGDSVDSAIQLLQRSDLVRQLTPCPDFAAAVRMAERLRLAPIPGDERDCQGNPARCAIELAILDAYGRAFGEPLMNVTKMLANDLYQPQETVQYSGILLTAKGWKARLLSLAYWWKGFRDVKVKVGIAGRDDVRRLKVIRRWLGRKIDIRVDANEAWSPAEVAEKILALQPFGISSVEQPVPHEQVAALADVRKQIQTPIMLDESLCSEVDAERALRGGWCDIFNLRLSKCGGFIPTLRLAQFAARHNLGSQLGCMVGETGILSAAGRQFATSVKKLRHLEGSFDRYLVWDPLTTEDLTFGRGGSAPARVGCGLSVTIDPTRLDAVTIRQESLLGERR